MAELYRFGVSMPAKLLEEFDRYIERRHYTNRSEAIRDLIREKLVEEEWRESNEEVIGTITYVYDHHKRELADRLMDIQHDHYQEIISTQHVHLDHDRCLEVVIVKGKAENIKELSDKIKSLKGIIHCQLAMTTTGKKLV
ncbi:transcriptional regulator NikR, CopG family [Thermodesulfatator indicus DSM 15286]|uniref:Putative nickel-responsive regulator n=1 Tax=Thermodesulfatator indicus (strain DSM 15286 / JCM 11887 / CIR29812) TaxID=667014 RepID=F8AE31_THEID|nr:nickel-responsive transcriptional regulator NikR [Thermodesulfatator indicus]AEH46077.1 transcriptional regulator NikR, CopG family [Thermodesulfatator indicus DSM 15286]